MLVCGKQTAELVQHGGGVMLDYLTEELKGRVFRRSRGNLIDLTLQFVGVDSRRYRVDEIIPPVRLEDIPDIKKWQVRATDELGASSQFRLGELVILGAIYDHFDRQFEPVHLLLKPGAVLFSDEPGAHPALPTEREDLKSMAWRPSNLLASLQPAYSRPSLLEAERDGADDWFALRAALFWQLSDRLMSKVTPGSNPIRALDATYRTVAFALASYGCSRASRLEQTQKNTDLIRLIRERVEFCHATHQNQPRSSAAITAGWAMLANAAFAQRLASAVSGLFERGRMLSLRKRARAKTPVREWRHLTVDRLQALRRSTKDDTRLAPLVARANYLLDSSDLAGQRHASLVAEVLEFHQQAYLASAGLSEV